MNDALDLPVSSFSLGTCYQGKVRDCYDLGKYLLLISSDRISAFDRVLTTIPNKGRILNMLSAWWLEETAHEVPNHLVSMVDQSAMLVKKCRVFPVEFIVRGYLTGSTRTSMWTLYEQGQREFNGVLLQEGMQKNQCLPCPVLTPTTKEEKHDRPTTAHEIIAKGWMTADEWAKAEYYARVLFEKGRERAEQKGLLLVDTKYEFGMDDEGQVVLVDEVHTPDSSRFWLKSDVHEHYDKEWLRLWVNERYDPYSAKEVVIPEDVRLEVSRRYRCVYEWLTGYALPEAEVRSPEEFDVQLKRRVAAYL